MVSLYSVSKVYFSLVSVIKCDANSDWKKVIKQIKNHALKAIKTL